MTHQKKKNKPQQMNWFGEEQQPRRKPNKNSVSFLGLKNTNSKPVSFLGMGKPMNNKAKIPNQVSFLGLSKTGKGKPSPLFRKESIRSKRRLSKWGDADLDGSPNYFDCDPVNWLKDQQAPDVQQAEAKMMDASTILSQVEKGNGGSYSGKTIYDQSPTDFSNQLAASSRRGARNIAGVIKRTARTTVQLTKDKMQQGRKGLLEGLKGKGIKDYGAQRSYERGIVATAKELFGKQKRETPAVEQLKEQVGEIKRARQQLAKDKKEGLITEAKYDEDTKNLNAKESVTLAYQSKIAGAEKGYQIYKAAIETPGLAGKIKVAELRIEEKKAKGKVPTPKEIAALAALEKKTKIFGEKGKTVVEKMVPGGGTLLAVTGANLGKGGVYSKEQRAKSARVRRMTATASGLLFGANMTRSGMGATFGSEPRGRGRPAGPSGEYKIGGRPVYEGEFREWESKQGALNRMLPSEAQTATLNPDYIEYIKKQQEQRNQAVQQARAVATQQIPEGQTEMGADGEPLTPQQMEIPTQQQLMQQEGMSTEEAQQIMRDAEEYTRAKPNEIRQAQHNAQMQDNILKAPNINKGELKNAGGTLLTANGPQIMDAPNAFAGEMRNVTKQGERPAVLVGERPSTNPFGDEYLEIELGSGKPVIRKRIRERWITGEAL